MTQDDDYDCEKEIVEEEAAKTYLNVLPSY
jgi:hypothetical protein